VLAVNERGGIVLDRTVFYAAAGGQPGDKGSLEVDGGRHLPDRHDGLRRRQGTIVHVAADGSARPAPGQTVRAVLDWDARSKLMRNAHDAAPAVRAGEVSGHRRPGQSGRQPARLRHRGRLAVDKEALTAGLNALIAANHPVSERWITDAELEANPQLVRTMAVKPPTGSGRVRLVVIGEGGSVDLQPCGGTHVRSTGEIGPVVVTRIEKKGKQNRRIRVSFA
jgi:misacylated tRNA(Ala) deacylase